MGRVVIPPSYYGPPGKIQDLHRIMYEPLSRVWFTSNDTSFVSNFVISKITIKDTLRSLSPSTVSSLRPNSENTWTSVCEQPEFYHPLLSSVGLSPFLLTSATLDRSQGRAKGGRKERGRGDIRVLERSIREVYLIQPEGVLYHRPKVFVCKGLPSQLQRTRKDWIGVFSTS